MGGVFGHMSHIYDNPAMTFGQIKDIMIKAADGKLENVTEKTDGQNLFVSYNVGDGTQRWVEEAQVRAARNKGDIRNGGMTPEQLATKFAGRGALEEAFVNAFQAFARTMDKLSDEQKLTLFGPDTNIYYNAEVMDPANANVINYDTKTFLIHRAGHAEYDKETGKPIKGEEGFSERQAQMLQDVLEQSQEELADDQFRVQVNAIRKDLEPLSDGTILETAIAGMDRAMSVSGMNDNDTIADYIFAQWKELVGTALPELTDKQEKLIIDRVMTDYYGALEGEGPLRSRGLETRQIKKVIGRPDLDEAIISLIKDYPRHFKEFIFPIESVIHRFSVEILRAVKSAYIIAAGGNEVEVARLQALVGKAIDTIQASGNEEAMEIIKDQVEKLSRIEDDGSIGDVDLSMISSAAEGIVFDYDGHTYKFTGGFAPANQILGLFKYGRKGIPAFAGDLAEGRWLFEQQDRRVVAIYPGRFQPMGRHHFQTFQEIAQKYGLENTFVATSNKRDSKSPLSFEEKKLIMMKHGIPESHIVQTRNPYAAVEVLEGFDSEETAAVYLVGAKDMAESPRFQNLDGVKKDGSPAHLKTLKDDEELLGFNQHSYVGVSPHVELNVPGYGEMSGTTLRKALKTASPEEFETIMGWFDEDIYHMLRAGLNEVNFGEIISKITSFSNPKKPSGRREDEEELDEMSSMAGGNVAGYSLPLGSRAPKVAGSEKKKKRHPKNFLEEEELVTEVVDYLLGITVG